MSLPSLFYKLFFFFISLLVFSKETFSEIKDLNGNNIESTLNSNENFLVLFFVENCSKCNIMYDFFAELSKETQKLNLTVNFFRLNVNENPDLASNFPFIDAPNIMLILGKYKIFYNYNEDSDIKEMLDFLNRKLSLRITTIKNLEELYLNKNKHMLIFCGSINPYFDSNEIEELSYYYDESVNFTITSSIEIMDKLGCKENNDTIIFLNKEEIKKYHPSDGSLKEWLSKEIIPLIYDLSLDKIKYIIDQKLPALIYFIKYSDNSFISSYNRFYQLSKKYKDQLIFLNSFKSRSDVIDVIQEMFTILNKDMPAILGINFYNDKMIQYILNKSLINDEKELNSFFENFLNGNKNYLNYLSEQTYSNSKQKDGNVTYLTAFSFKKLLEETNKDVVLFVEDSISCVKCNSVYSIFKDLSGNIFSNITFAKLDISVNELPDLEIGKNLPKILFFPHDKKSSNIYNNLKVYQGDYSEGNIFKFIENHTTYPLLFVQSSLSYIDSSNINVNSDTFKFYHINKVIDFDRSRELIDNKIQSDIFRQSVIKDKIDEEQIISKQELNEENETQVEEVPVNSEHEEDDSASRKSDL